jgi:hypothetical protein
LAIRDDAIFPFAEQLRDFWKIEVFFPNGWEEILEGETFFLTVEGFSTDG